MRDRLDAVEIKVTVTGDAIDRARDVLGVRGDGEKRRIFFHEGRDLPLLAGGVILRVRRTPNGDDTTVKLRPCERSHLTRRWLQMRTEGRHEFRLEADWAGGRRVLAASLVARDRREFSRKQREFLADCAGVPVDLALLTALGPVRARRWAGIGWAGLDVVAERWTVPDGLDFFEMSVRADPDDAAGTQRRFEAALRRHGIEADPDQETKTRAVLEHFSKQWVPSVQGVTV